MIRQGLNGFLMALADSVPGVSGGTVAFIMGFGKARNRLGNRHGAGGADIVISF